MTNEQIVNLMVSPRHVQIVLFAAAIITRTEAAIVTYDASSGLLPQSSGWIFTDQNNPSSTVSVSGGILTHESTLSNRAFWDLDLDAVNGTPGDSGVFMESTLKIVTEFNTSSERGVQIATAGAADGVNGSIVRLVGNEDRVFLQDDFTDQMLTSVVMDTTDAFHTYRLEILQEKVWLFIDGNFATSATTSVAPFATLDIGGNFGDGSVFSESVTERMSVIVGSLADIGGPSMPEPATGCMLMLGMAVMFLGGRTLVPKLK
jgi:hypothetical protein